jgi:formylglycine-generating enzyme required for sulfatase activity
MEAGEARALESGRAAQEPLVPTKKGVYELSVPSSEIPPSGEISVKVQKEGYAIKPDSIAAEVPIPVVFEDLTAVGGATSTLILNFDQDIDLKVENITIDDPNGTGTTKGTLTETDTPGEYKLAVTGITKNGTITLSVKKEGFAISPKSKEVQVSYITTSVEFSNLSANGEAMEKTTTLTLKFDQYIPGLKAEDIKIDANGTGTTKVNDPQPGNVDGLYELIVKVTASGTITVTVDKAGYAINPPSLKTAVYGAPAVPHNVSFFSLGGDGGPTETTSKLVLIFGEDIEGLKAEDIKIDANGTGITTGVLTQQNPGVYELAVKSIASSGTITIIPAKQGYTITPASLSTTVYGIRTTETYNTAGVSFKMISAASPEKINFPKGIDNDEIGSVTKAYQIGETEVTWELWNTVRDWAKNNGYDNISVGQAGSTENGEFTEPVTTISWYDAVVWCNALTEWYNDQNDSRLEPVYRNGDAKVIREVREGDEGDWEVIPDATATGFRLPTSDEWELAARWQGKAGLTNFVYYDGYFYTEGNSASGAEADYDDAAATSAVGWYNLPDETTAQPVKGKDPNALGLYDMSGNVSEWCSDRGSGDRYVIRGGSYLDTADKLQIGKVDQSPTIGGETIGFRLARTAK